MHLLTCLELGWTCWIDGAPQDASDPARARFAPPPRKSGARRGKQDEHAAVCAGARTVENLREALPRIAALDAEGLERLCAAMQDDAPFRDQILNALDHVQLWGAPAGAGLAEKFEALAVKSISRRLALCAHQGGAELLQWSHPLPEADWPHVIGPPMPGDEFRLSPYGER